MKPIVHVAGGYPAAVAVPELLCCDILSEVAPLRDFMTFTQDVIFLFAMIMNLLFNRLVSVVMRNSI